MFGRVGKQRKSMTGVVWVHGHWLGRELLSRPVVVSQQLNRCNRQCVKIRSRKKEFSHWWLVRATNYLFSFELSWLWKLLFCFDVWNYGACCNTIRWLPLTFFSLGLTFTFQSKSVLFFFVLLAKSGLFFQIFNCEFLPSLKFTSQVMEHHSAGCNRLLLVACINYLGCWGRILRSLPKNTTRCLAFQQRCREVKSEICYWVTIFHHCNDSCHLQNGPLPLYLLVSHASAE